MPQIVIKSGPTHMILGTDGEDAVVKGLRLLILAGNEKEKSQAINLLNHLGVSVHEPPV